MTKKSNCSNKQSPACSHDASVLHRQCSVPGFGGIHILFQARSQAGLPPSLATTSTPEHAPGPGLLQLGSCLAPCSSPPSHPGPSSEPTASDAARAGQGAEHRPGHPVHPPAGHPFCPPTATLDSHSGGLPGLGASQKTGSSPASLTRLPDGKLTLTYKVLQNRTQLHPYPWTPLSLPSHVCTSPLSQSSF